MHKKLLYPLAGIFFFTSCKSLQNLSTQRSQVTSQSVINSNDVHFLDDISVTPGSKSSSNKYVYNNVKKRKKSEAISKKSASTESGNTLKIKYANLLDVPASDLNNMLLLQNIDEWWGTKYCIGGETNSCIDCSAFTQAIMRDVYRKRIPRTAKEQYRLSSRVKQKSLKQGDLVFFHTTSKSVSHVGIYLANNKFVHASSSNGVTISDLTSDYWHDHYTGGGRINLNDAATASVSIPADKKTTAK